MLINYQGQYYSCTGTDSISHEPKDLYDINGLTLAFILIMSYFTIEGLRFLYKIITFKE